ncbi:MAG: DUF433 domain-containing protein [Actinomycetota bacterium]|nr:DUF433 domain-containing protein [Actinomycetota bacterium]
MTSAGDIRVAVPLYTVAEAARYVRVPTSTYATWVKGYERRLDGGRHVHGDPVVTALPAPRGEPTIPFVGLAESMVLAAFRKSGVSLQHIRQTILALEREIGMKHALASQRLYTDGAVILYDFAEHSVGDAAGEELAELTRVVDGQRVFTDVVRECLRRMTYADDGLAAELVLPYGDRDVLRIRPDQAGGRPLFVRGRAPLDEAVARWRAGDRIAAIAEDFNVPADDLEDALRVAVVTAA